MERNSNSIKGFTLTELIVIIIIAGILALFIAPKLGINTFKESADVDNLLTIIRYAQYQSMVTGNNWRIKILSANAILVDNDSIDSNENPNLPGEDNPVKLNTSIISNRMNEIYFDWLGRPVDSNGKLISTQINFIVNNSKTVIIEPFSGGVYEE